MPIFDTHAHYNDNAFRKDREELLSALPAAGVGAAVIPGVDAESSRSALALAESRPWLFAAAGITRRTAPAARTGTLTPSAPCAPMRRWVAIGEIGLDYYWAENPPKEFQQTVFRRQLELALELDLPVIVHDREATGTAWRSCGSSPGSGACSTASRGAPRWRRSC